MYHHFKYLIHYLAVGRKCKIKQSYTEGSSWSAFVVRDRVWMGGIAEDHDDDDDDNNNNNNGSDNDHDGVGSDDHRPSTGSNVIDHGSISNSPHCHPCHSPPPHHHYCIIIS